MTTVELPVPLSADQIADLSSIQAEFAKVEILAGDYHKRRALNFRAQWQFVASVGKLTLEHHVEKVLGFNVDAVRSTGYAVCAMGVTGIDTYAVEGDDRTARHNRVQSVQQALNALFNLREQHEGLTDDDFVAWYNEAGRLSGIYNKSRPTKQSKDDEQHDEAKVDAAIATIIGNPAAIEADVSLAPGAVTVFVAEGMGSKARLVRMDVDRDFIAGLVHKAPDPMQNAPDKLIFFRQLLMTTKLIVPDAISDQPLTTRKDGEKVSASTPMLPAHAIILVDGGKFSAASSRTEDTIIIQAEGPDDARFDVLPDGYIDTRTRHTMEARLEESRIAAGYIAKDIDLGTSGRISFDHTDKKLSGQLKVKPLTEMGSLWTHRVRDFKTKVDCELSDKGIAELGAFGGSLRGKDSHPIGVEVKDGKLFLRHGTAKPVVIGGDVGGADVSVEIKQDDFKRVLPALLDLPLQELFVGVDPRGLVRITACTSVAGFRVFIQTLRKGDGDAKVRERALLERVEKPTVQVELLAA